MDDCQAKMGVSVNKRCVAPWLILTFIHRLLLSSYVIAFVPLSTIRNSCGSCRGLPRFNGPCCHMVDPWNEKEQPVSIVIGEADTMIKTESILFDKNEDEKAELAATAAQFGQSVPMRALTTPSITSDSNPIAKGRRRQNILVACLSILLAISNFVWQWTHPSVTPLTILSEMEQRSPPIDVIGNNGKPTLIDFWAPWCENCKIMAPTLQALEHQYEGKVNFVMMNGADTVRNGYWVDRFGVDAIPHLALVSSDGLIETALIGIIPKHVLAADLDVMIENSVASVNKKQCRDRFIVARSATTRLSSTESDTPSETTCTDTPISHKILPYQMYDAFASRPESRYLRLD